jgi:DNA polymerase
METRSMRIICMDAESYFDDEFTLKKLTSENYIRGERFECHGWSIKWGPDYEPRWYSHREAQYIFKQEDWNQIAVIAHNAAFDGLILSHHYGIKPAFWFDTLSMARLVLGNFIRVSLDNLAKHFGLAAKTVPYDLFKGKHWHELTSDVQRQVAEGCCHDVALTWQLFNILRKGFPTEEYEVVDITIRMFTEPVILGDLELLAKIWKNENAVKTEQLRSLGVVAAELQSADHFAQLLREADIEPETKQGKNGPIFAFAKTDDFMRDLLENEDPYIRALAEARLGQKSTLMQTRAERLGWMARRGPLCIPLKYCGAHTTRWSGDGSINPQNFKRQSDLRRAIMAPEGYLAGVVDLSQIECRVGCWLAGQQNYLEIFRSKGDPYAVMATKVYGERIYKPEKDDPRKEEMEAKRGTGKQLTLSCMYQAGAASIQRTAKLGAYGPPVKIDLSTAYQWRDAYRKEFNMVVKYWSDAGRMIARIAGGEPYQWGPVLIKDKKLYGPGGTMLHYDTLEYDAQLESWKYRNRTGWTKFYPGKLVENVVQWLARLVVSQAMLRIKGMGYRIVSSSHDDIGVVLANDGKAEKHMLAIAAEMKREPVWMPGIPLDAEWTLGERFSK